ncbi:MAG: AsmA family protein [Desulfobacteraceae bacterium]|jgi:uncharacterized protein involved in outer membrane biogenesis|nr:AsmA family protein [Desulfobacteraceae bacterium]
MATDDEVKGPRRRRNIVRIAVIGAAALVCAVLVVIAFNIPLNLSPVKDDIAALAKRRHGIDIAFEGELYLIPGWRPAVEIQGLLLRPPHPQEVMLRLEYLKLGVELLPLVKKKLRVTEIVANGLGLNLRGPDPFNIRPEGQVEFPQSREPASVTQPQKTPPWRVEVMRIDLRDATVSMNRRDSVFTVAIPQISGSATDEHGLKLGVKAIYEDTPWDLDIDGGSLTALFERPAAWPLEISARGAGGELFVGGRIHPLEKRTAFDVRLSGRITPQLEALLGANVAAFEDYHLDCRLDLADSLLRLTDLEARLGNTRFTGDGRWNGVEKRLTGAVNAAVLDLGPIWHSANPVEGRESILINRRGAEREVPFTLSDVASHLDVDLHFSIDRIEGIPGRPRNATARFVAGDGRVDLPLFITVFETTISGEAALILDEETVKLFLDLAAEKTDPGRMAGEGDGGVKLAGRLDELSLSASASGANLAGVLKSLTARLEISNADVTIDGKSAGRPIRVALDTATVRLPAGEDIHGIFKGKLHGESFSLNFAGGGMRDILEKSRWPLDLRFAGAGAKLHLSGTILPIGNADGPALSIRLSGDRIGALAAWTGISPSAAMPYTMDVTGSIKRKKWHLDVRQLTVGRSTLKGSIGKKFSRGQQIKTAFSFRSDFIDVPQLKTLFFLPDAGGGVNSASKRPKAAEAGAARILDTIIFPKGFHLPDMDVDLDIRRMVTEKLSYSDCLLEAGIRRDRTTRSRFQFVLEKSAFEGELILDLIRQTPVLGLRVSTSQFDIGKLLDDLDMVKGVDAGVKTVEINVTTRGRRLSELIFRRQIDFRAQDGRWVLKDSPAAVAIHLDKAEYADKPGDPFRLDVHGRIKDFPLTMRCLVQKKLSDDAAHPGRAFDFEAEVAGTRLELTGSLVFPLTRRGVAHRFHLIGERLSHLSPLLNVYLPPVGPYKAAGVIRIQPEAYLLSDTEVSIGASRFLGKMRFVTEGPRPKVEANFEAKVIQLTDFAAGDPASSPGDKPSNAGTQTGGNSEKAQRRQQLRRLFDPAVDAVMDADISIAAAEVLAGETRLGNGALRVMRKKKNLSIAPLALSIPGGDVDIAVDLNGMNGGVSGALKVDIQQLDFGPLLRLKDPGTTNSGRVSLIIDLNSTAESTSALLAQANGRVFASIQPENIRAGVLDFWAVNLLTALLPVFNPNSESKINCIVADLAMENGFLKEKAIVIDTSKIRVRGTANVDLKKQTIRLNLKPTPKRPQFISLATPVEVRGTFSDFGVRPVPGSLIGTVIRIFTAHIVVPIQWIILNKLPEDGSDVCRDVIGN